MILIRKKTAGKNLFPFMLVWLIFLLPDHAVFAAKSLTLPAKIWGICFGNSPRFNGLRFNIIDEKIEVINGINITLWKSRDKKISGTVNGLSLGVIPYAAELKGIQIGLLGSGAGDRVIGLNLGGLGMGAGESVIGLNLGGLGMGAGENVIGLNFGGLGMGAGENVIGLNFGGLGVGAGEKVMGITIAGLGAGAGEKLIGLTISGLGAGAPTVVGLTIAGLGVGGNRITGVSLALGTIHIAEDGVYRGLAVSAFNYIKGTMKGVAIGIVNYAYRLKGLQIGLVNIVRDNPRGRVILPIINFNF